MLVGRDRVLKQCLQALADGRPLLVVGEAGVGKTALLQTVAASLGTPSFEGGGLATLAWVSYLPLYRATGVGRPGEDPADVAMRVRERVGGATLVLDDLQWVDAVTLRVIGSLARGTTLIAGVRRPDAGAGAALESLVAAGFETIDLAPLADAEAAELVRTRRPTLGRREIETVVARAAGLPLLLEELSPDGALDGSLRLSIATRLRALSPRAREGMALIALAGRPLSERLVPAADELVGDGLATARPDGIEVRHALLGEAAVDALDADTQRRLHAYLAAVVNDAGEAARHHLAAGEREAAYAAAMHAADAADGAARIAHLRVAALAAPQESAPAIVLEAASALVEAGRVPEIDELLEHVTAHDEATRGRFALLRARTAFARRDEPAAWAALAEAEAGADAVADADFDVQRALVRASLHSRFDQSPALSAATAEQALALARRHGRRVGEALVLSSSLRGEGWEGQLREAIDDSDPRVASMAGNNLVFALLLDGRAAEALATARAARDVAESAGRTATALRFAMWCVAMSWYSGNPGDAAALADELIILPLDPFTRADLEFYASQAWLDVGRNDDARAVLEPRVRDDARTHFARGEALWALADVELWSGRAQRSHELAELYLAEFDVGVAFVSAIRGWAAVELGRDPGLPPPPSPTTLVQGARPELLALASAHRGDHHAAVGLFDESARLWTGRYARGALRCRLAAAESARKAGDETAVSRLLALERDCAAAGYVHIEARVRRSLRLAGERRAAPRVETRHGLTEREDVVLQLVAQGLSNTEIAARLGVGRSTVERQVEAACRKLGVRTRAQAAARISA